MIPFSSTGCSDAFCLFADRKQRGNLFSTTINQSCFCYSCRCMLFVALCSVHENWIRGKCDQVGKCSHLGGKNIR
jgi:hypothetical protein